MAGDLDIVGIREATEADRAFVMDSWLSSFQPSHFAGPISIRRYRDVYSEEISDLILRPKTYVRVAHNNTKPDQIFGYICFERGHRYPVIHYIYIKQALRSRGIGRVMVHDAAIDLRRRFLYTYRTPLAHDLTKRGAKFQHGKFSPEIARYDPEDKDPHDQDRRRRVYPRNSRDNRQQDQ